jgi:hypothetical protein
MVFNVELDIPHTATPELIKEFAESHGCVAKMIMPEGPGGGNPVYNFSSERYSYLEELVEQIYGVGSLDQETIKTMIWET